MPTSTYTPLATKTLTATAASIIFSSIPSIYRDLVIVAQASTTATASLCGRINGDTASNYFWIAAGGDGTTTVSQKTTTGSSLLSFGDRSIYSGTNPAQHIIHFLDYSQSNKHKTVISRGSSSAAGVDMVSNRWQSTAIINTITLFPNMNSFATGSTFALYGIAG